MREYGPRAIAYATAVFGEPQASDNLHSWYVLLNAEHLDKFEVPASYAAQLPWEDSYGTQGYNSEDIAALYQAGVPAEWAKTFHDVLLGRRGNIEASLRLHIDEMVYPIAAYLAGIEPGYAAKCALRRLSIEDTRRLHASVASEYLDGVL